jgi:hypothetical protein
MDIKKAKRRFRPFAFFLFTNYKLFFLLCCDFLRRGLLRRFFLRCHVTVSFKKVI